MRIVILRPVALGDTLLTFPIFSALREKYTDVHISFVGIPSVLPLAQAWGLADEVYESSQFPWDDLYSEEGIRSTKWLNIFQQTDLAIYLMRYSTEQVAQNLLRAGAKEAITPHENPPHILPMHWVDYLAKPLGLHDVGKAWIPPGFQGEKEFCLYNPPIAIHPGCSDASRMWQATSFAAVINRLMHLQQPVLLLAGPVDTEQLEDVRRHLSSHPRAELLTLLQNAPLLEVAQRIKQCKCYLGNDSGVTHMAALLGVPTIALFRPLWVLPNRPIGPAVEVLQGEPLKRLSAEQVFESVRKYI